MKSLALILATVASPVFAGDAQRCADVANVVRTIAEGRDAGISLIGAQQIVLDSASEEDAAPLLGLITAIYQDMSGISPGDMGVMVFNECVEKW